MLNAQCSTLISQVLILNTQQAQAPLRHAFIWVIRLGLFCPASRCLASVPVTAGVIALPMLTLCNFCSVFKNEENFSVPLAFDPKRHEKEVARLRALELSRFF